MARMTKKVTLKKDHPTTRKLESAASNKVWPGRFNHYVRSGIRNDAAVSYESQLNPRKRKPRKGLDPLA